MQFGFVIAAENRSLAALTIYAGFLDFIARPAERARKLLTILHNKGLHVMVG